MKLIGRIAFLATFSCTFIFVPHAAHAQASSTTADSMFAKKAAQGGMAEVKLGELAQKMGSSDAVKEFGKRMETDHSKANDRLKDIASKQSVTLPTTIDKMDNGTYNRLSKLSGAQFDREYARVMVSDHEKDIAEFKKEANTGKNAGIKDFASETLPTLEDHLKQAREMEKTVTSSETSKNIQ